MEVHLQLWQLIVGALVTVLIGGASGGGLFWYLVESRRIQATAEEAAHAQALTSWKKLADEQQQRITNLHESVARQGQRIQAQEDLILSLQKDLSRTRAELATTRRQLSAAQAQIDLLESENAALSQELRHERRRRRELEKRVEETNGAT